MWSRAIATLAVFVVARLQGARAQDTASVEESPCVHSVYLEQIVDLEAELAMYRQASNSGLVCVLGGQEAHLDGQNGTYTITSDT